MQLVAQVGYFLIIARALGPTGYGTFLACTALAAVLAPFSPLGTGQVLVKYIARDKRLMPLYLGNAVTITAGMGLLLILIVSLLRSLLLPSSVSLAMLFAVGVADLICAQLTYVCAQALLATGRARHSSSLMVVSASARFAAAIALIMTGVPSVSRWVGFYLAASVLAVAYASVVICQTCAPPRFTLDLLWASIQEGFHFSTSLAAQTVYNDIDKTMLARLSSVQGAAIYAVAYRFIEVSMLPIRSLQSAAYPEFFRHGAGGMKPSFTFAKRILHRSVLYGIFASVVLFFSAQFLPLVMGSAYADSTVALQWLCPLPLIQSVHAFLSDTLTGADYQVQRSRCQIGVALFNILINLWLIRAWAWRGASWSSIASEMLLAVFLFLLIRFYLRKERSRPDIETSRVGATVPEVG